MLGIDQIGSKCWEPYVILLARCEESSWSYSCWTDLRGKYAQAELQIPEYLVLIHPKWYQEEAAADEVCPVRGRGGFRQGGRDSPGACESFRYWGYRCPWPNDRGEYDHWFPRSLGGPTDLRNAMWLCKWHNKMAKGADIHVLDPQKERLQWFEDTLKAVEDQLNL